MTIMLQRDNQHYGTLVKCLLCKSEYKLETSQGTEPRFCAMCGDEITKLIWCSPEYPRWMRERYPDADWHELDDIDCKFRKKMDENAKLKPVVIKRYRLALGEWVVDNSFNLSIYNIVVTLGSMHKAIKTIDDIIKRSKEDFFFQNDLNSAPEDEDDYMENVHWQCGEFEFEVTLGDKSVFVRHYKEWDWVPESHRKR